MVEYQLVRDVPPFVFKNWCHIASNDNEPVVEEDGEPAVKICCVVALDAEGRARDRSDGDDGPWGEGSSGMDLGIQGALPGHSNS